MKFVLYIPGSGEIRGQETWLPVYQNEMSSFVVPKTAKSNHTVPVPYTNSNTFQWAHERERIQSVTVIEKWRENPEMGRTQNAF